MPPASDPSALTAQGTAAYRQQVEEAAETLLNVLPSAPTVGILYAPSLGSPLADKTVTHSLSYDDLPHVPTADGTIQVGAVEGTTVAALPQPLHLYDGHTAREVTFPVRLLATTGVGTLLLAGTAGSVSPQFGRGDVMLLTDHINFQGQNPLVGPNVEDWGPRFPDMTAPYNASLQRAAGDVARNIGTPLRKGIYLSRLGPEDETSAEHRMARRLGANAVGAGLVPEVIAARHMDVSVLALALLTREHSPDSSTPTPLVDDRALDTARSRLRRLLRGIVARAELDDAS